MAQVFSTKYQKYKGDKDYSKISEIFEQIYWLNPDIIRHIELNFRKLIRIHPKEFNNYISKIQEYFFFDQFHPILYNHIL